MPLSAVWVFGQQPVLSPPSSSACFNAALGSLGIRTSDFLPALQLPALRFNAALGSLGIRTFQVRSIPIWAQCFNAALGSLGIRERYQLGTV